jgi:predicted XRE-type DNA-binding protein
MPKTYKNVFEATEKDGALAHNLYIRGQLMMRVKKYIADKNLTQKQAADLLGVAQPRISDLVRGKIDLFTIDMLVNMLARAEIFVEINLKDAA